MSISEFVQKVVLVTSAVDSLKSDIKRFDTVIRDLQDRIVRLEAAGDLFAEKAKNAALQGAHAMTSDLQREIYELKGAIEKIEPIKITKASKVDENGNGASIPLLTSDETLRSDKVGSKRGKQ